MHQPHAEKNRVQSAYGFCAWKLQYDEMVLNFAFNFNLRRYQLGKVFETAIDVHMRPPEEVGWCRLTLSNPW